MSGHSVELTLGTNNSALKTGLDQARHQVEGFKDQTREMLMGLFAGIGIEQLLEKFGHVQDQAEAFGTTAEAVQRVDQLAQQAGASVDDVAKAMAKLRVNSDGLGKLGINPDEFMHSDMDQQLLMVAEALGEIEDPAQRVNVAIEVFGSKLAGKILPMLNMGAEEMKAFFDSANVASNATVAELDAAGDRLTQLKNDFTVGAAMIFGLVDNLWQSFTGGLGASLSVVLQLLDRIDRGMAALANGDFSGMKTQFSALADDMGKAGENVADAFKKPFENGATGITDRKRISKKTGIEEDAEGGSKRLSVAERIKALEEEHALKQLDVQERLNKLGEEKLAIEKELSGLANADDAKRKQLEDRLVANARDRLSAQDELKREQDRAAQEQLDELNKQSAEYDKELKKRAKEEEKAREEQSKEEEKAAKKREKDEQRQKLDRYREQERDLGFVSGIKQVGESGQQLSGVNYSVINSEAERGIKLQEEMRNYMKIIAEKEYSVELPDAS